MTEIENIYHERDAAAAIRRANDIKGCVILSKGPESKGLQNERGFWSGVDRMVRNWEAMVFDSAWGKTKKTKAVLSIAELFPEFHEPAVQMWISVNERLPKQSPDEDYGTFRNSVSVLATDGKVIFTAYVQWSDNLYEMKEDTIQWKELGRDSYDFNNVTHWMPLPELPR